MPKKHTTKTKKSPSTKHMTAFLRPSAKKGKVKIEPKSAPVKGDVRYNATKVGMAHMTTNGMTYREVTHLVASMNGNDSYVISSYWDKEAP
jgi:hypothetical protein